MDKKLYLEPEMEVVMLEAEGYLVDSSTGGFNDDYSSEKNDNPGDDFFDD